MLPFEFLDVIDSNVRDIVAETILRNLDGCVRYINDGGPGKADFLRIMGYDRSQYRITVWDRSKKRDSIQIPYYLFELKGPEGFCFESKYLNDMHNADFDIFTFSSGKIRLLGEYRFANSQTVAMLN